MKGGSVSKGNGCAGKDNATEADPVNPSHYRRGPVVRGETVECIEVVRTIQDYRLATAMKYIWRVAYGGKCNNLEDIQKAVWFLNDYCNNQIPKFGAK